MKTIKTALCAMIADHIHALRTKTALLPIGAALLIFSTASSFAQIDSTQLIGRGSSGPQTVSRNQLLAPGKAIRAIERARKEIIEGKLDSAQKEIARALDGEVDVLHYTGELEFAESELGKLPETALIK